MPTAIITGTGSYLPEKRLTNKELETRTFTNRRGEVYSVTSDEILSKTGILERRYAERESVSDMAARAGKSAIEAAGIHPDEIDLVILATSTPDVTIPKLCPLVAHKIGLHSVPAYDFGKDCTGFVEALEAASYYIMAGRYEHILVIGSDKGSQLVDPSNKGTTVLFGDGAGAAVVSACDDPNRGMLSAVAGSQGESFKTLYVPASEQNESEEETKRTPALVMDGAAVASYGKQVFAVGVERALAQEQLVPENLDLLIPHQSNLRIIESGAKALDLPLDKVVLTIEKTGNTASASIPMALDTAVRGGRLKAGNLVCFFAHGGGLSWISLLMRW